MDVSPTAAVNAALQVQQTQVPQQVQVAVLKKAMNIQESGALSLLQSVTGTLPLADSGHLGTKLNVLA